MNIIYLEKLGNLITSVNNFRETFYTWHQFKRDDIPEVEGYYIDFQNSSKEIIAEINTNGSVTRGTSLTIIGTIYFLLNKLQNIIDYKYYGVKFDEIINIHKLADELSDDLFIAINQ
jgi:hypothetical protein